MIEQFIDINTGDGAMNTFIVHPEEHGPHPLVLFLMDAPGMREEIRDMSRRLATAGYYVMAPHLYYRATDHYNLFETGDRDRMTELMRSLSNEKIVGDARALIAHADGDAAANATRVGVVGYCMSGPFAIYLAGPMNDRVRPAASFHGVRLVTDADDSPHLQLAAANAGWRGHIAADITLEHPYRDVGLDRVSLGDAARDALSELTDAPPDSVKTPIDRLAEAFPGSELMNDD